LGQETIHHSGGNLHQQFCVRGENYLVTLVTFTLFISDISFPDKLLPSWVRISDHKDDIDVLKVVSSKKSDTFPTDCFSAVDAQYGQP